MEEFNVESKPSVMSLI